MFLDLRGLRSEAVAPIEEGLLLGVFCAGLLILPVAQEYLGLLPWRLSQVSGVLACEGKTLLLGYALGGERGLRGGRVLGSNLALGRGLKPLFPRWSQRGGP